MVKCSLTPVPCGMNRPLSRVIELEQGQKKEDMIQSLKADEAELESLLARSRKNRRQGNFGLQHVLPNSMC